MSNVTDIEAQRLRRAYRDLITAELALVQSITELRAAGWTNVAAEQERGLAYVRDALHDLASFTTGQGVEL